jgi:hypothetical protein
LEEITHTIDGIKSFGEEQRYEGDGNGGKGPGVEIR